MSHLDNAATGTSHRVMVRAISLAGDIRRESFLKPMSKTIDFAFFDALADWPASWHYSEDKAYLHKGRPLSRSELGCYASHVCLWQLFLASDYDHILVVEDDVSVDWAAIDYILERRNILALNGLLRLFTRYPASHAIVGCTDIRFITRVFHYASGTQAYLIGKSAAQTLLNYCKLPSRPIDDQIDREWDHGIPTYVLFPFPCHERIGPSRIGPSRIGPESGERRLPKWHTFRRAAYRLKDAIAYARYRAMEGLHSYPRRWRAFD